MVKLQGAISPSSGTLGGALSSSGLSLYGAMQPGGGGGTNKIQYGTTEYWNAQVGLVSKAGTLYIYSDYGQDTFGNDVAGIKIGDGMAYVVDLPFVDAVAHEHINDSDIHITAAERQAWNDKVRCYFAGAENLIFTTL